MRSARYTTKAGAQRYADELKRRWPALTFQPVPHPADPFYAFAVATEKDGKIAYAGRRPKGFGKRNPSTGA
jgi:hypothetical protein